VAHAQSQARIHRIGYLSARATRSDIDDAFLDGMRERGYVVGRNVDIAYRWAGNDVARLQPYADELARLPVDVVVTATTAGVRAAMRATRTIPIVMAAAADPAGSGLVASLGRPGANVTGLSLQTTDMASKRLQLAREMVPGAARIALLAEKVDAPTQGTTALLVAETRASATRIGASLLAREIATADEIGEAFDSSAANAFRF
jgi:putative ABC transport system substrate-binding protein